MKRYDFNREWTCRPLTRPGEAIPVTLPHDAMRTEERVKSSLGEGNIGWFEGGDYEYKKCFTLAELLIVVAIIAVLVAIAIPVFTTQLEKSREATDIANTRSAYAEVVAEAIAATTPADLSAEVKLKQQQDGWQGADPTSTLANLDATYTGFTGSPKVTITGTPSQGGSATIEYTAAQGTTAAAVTITFD